MVKIFGEDQVIDSNGDLYSFSCIQANSIESFNINDDFNLKTFQRVSENYFNLIKDNYKVTEKSIENNIKCQSGFIKEYSSTDLTTVADDFIIVNPFIAYHCGNVIVNEPNVFLAARQLEAKIGLDTKFSDAKVRITYDGSSFGAEIKNNNGTTCNFSGYSRGYQLINGIKANSAYASCLATLNACEILLEPTFACACEFVKIEIDGNITVGAAGAGELQINSNGFISANNEKFVIGKTCSNNTCFSFDGSKLNININGGDTLQTISCNGNVCILGSSTAASVCTAGVVNAGCFETTNHIKSCTVCSDNICNTKAIRTCTVIASNNISAPNLQATIGCLATGCINTLCVSATFSSPVILGTTSCLGTSCACILCSDTASITTLNNTTIISSGKITAGNFETAGYVKAGILCATTTCSTNLCNSGDITSLRFFSGTSCLGTACASTLNNSGNSSLVGTVNIGGKLTVCSCLQGTGLIYAQDICATSSLKLGTNTVISGGNIATSGNITGFNEASGASLIASNIICSPTVETCTGTIRNLNVITLSCLNNVEVAGTFVAPTVSATNGCLTNIYSGVIILSSCLSGAALINTSGTITTNKQITGLNFCATGPGSTNFCGDLQVAGCICAGTQISANSFKINSLRVLKENIIPYEEDALNKIANLNIVSYNYKNDKNKELKVGIIADDTPEIFTGKEHSNLDISNTLGLVLKSLQTLSYRMDRMEKCLQV